MGYVHMIIRKRLYIRFLLPLLLLYERKKPVMKIIFGLKLRQLQLFRLLHMAVELLLHKERECASLGKEESV